MSEPETVVCPTCKGKGTVPEPFEAIRCDPPGEVTCPTCKGTGTVSEEK